VFLVIHSHVENNDDVHTDAYVAASLRSTLRVNALLAIGVNTAKRADVKNAERNLSEYYESTESYCRPIYNKSTEMHDSLVRIVVSFLRCYFCHFITCITFRVRRCSRGEMYIGHGRLCVCMCGCPSPRSHTTARTRM